VCYQGRNTHEWADAVAGRTRLCRRTSLALARPERAQMDCSYREVLLLLVGGSLLYFHMPLLVPLSIRVRHVLSRRKIPSVFFFPFIQLTFASHLLVYLSFPDFRSSPFSYLLVRPLPAMFLPKVVALGLAPLVWAKVQYLGIAIAGGDFGCQIDGTCPTSSVQFASDAGAQMTHFVGEGMNLIRIRRCRLSNT
jgi:hypothetical protein